jgi:transposase-like protein
MPKRKTFTASQKAAIVLEALKEEKTVAQIASENGVHPNQIHKWKKQALENFQQLFEDDRKGEKARAAAHENQVNELYGEIGKLSTQLNWLKKKSGLNVQ